MVTKVIFPDIWPFLSFRFRFILLTLLIILLFLCVFYIYLLVFCPFIEAVNGLLRGVFFQFLILKVNQLMQT